MDEFFKTKVGFTIGLLAAIFAFKPLVDANANIGFYIFSNKITIEYAYLFLTAFLGLAVYFISLQFASSKHVELLNRLSDTCYSIALATPPVFIVFWFISFTLNYLATFIHQAPENIISLITGGITGILTGIFATIFSSVLKKSITSKFNAQERVIERKENIELLDRSKKLINSGMYDMSVLESSKVIESVLTRLLIAKGISLENRGIQNLIKLSREHGILTQNEIKILNEIRIKRNESVHLIDSIDINSAIRVLKLSQELILKLESISSSFGFEWLEKNRKTALKTLKEGDHIRCQHIIKMLADAWRNRDGAVWLELAEFFEVILKYNPYLLVEMFYKNKDILNSWLESIDGQFFKDYQGGQRTRLESLRETMLLRLNEYMKIETKEEHLLIAERISKAIKEAVITEIF